MRVLVTGNLGYIGPVIVRRLLEAGHYVIGADTGWYVHQYAGDPVWPDVQHFADIRHPRDSMFEGIGAIVHLAGLSNDPIGDLDPAVTEDINLSGTLGMLTPGIRNLVVSSCSVYGANDTVATEATLPNAQTTYAKCKADVDRFLDSGLWPYEDWVSLRLGTVYGYSPGHRLDLVVNKMTFDALARGHVTASGNAWRPLTHVEDVADAVLFFLTRGQGVYNIVGENRQMNDLAREVGRFADVPVVLKATTGDTRNYRASGDRAAFAGWTPAHTVAGSLPALFKRTLDLPAGRIYERLPIARRHLDKEPVAA